MKVQFVPVVPAGGTIQLEVDEAGLQLGRGPILKIDTTSVSRKHVILSVRDEQLRLLCLHRKPVHVVSKGNDHELGLNDERVLEDGDLVKFTPENFHYSLRVSPDKGSDTVAAHVPTTTDPDSKDADQHTKVDSAANKACNQPAGNIELTDLGRQEPISGEVSEKEPRGKRKLPAWMTKNQTSLAIKGDSPAKKSEKKGPSASATMGPSTPSAAVSSGAPSTSKGAVARDIVNAAKKIPKKDATRNKAVVYPTVVTAADFEDSDDEEGKKPLGKKKATRPACEYGASCYRKNPVHFKQKSHPGDDDHRMNTEVDDDRPECEYGLDCFRRNPIHKKNFKHTHKPQPKRKAKAQTSQKKDDDEYESDFIDDDEEDAESIDDTDEDEDWKPKVEEDTD